MNYEEAIAFIHGPNGKGMKLGLDNIKELMYRLGDPQKKQTFIHIAGTNGKGSVASFVSQVLIQAGYKTGLFTSPFLQKFNERIKINNQDISDEDLSRVTTTVKETLEATDLEPTEFELVTSIALQYFYEQQCDIVVLEVGLGGRLDSTNVIENPILSIITLIGLDHQAYLGSTLREIAYEKAGIIKHNGEVLVYPQDAEAESVIEHQANEQNASVTKADFSRLENKESDLDGHKFSYKDVENMRISLVGEHQLKNAALAIEAVRILNEKEFQITDEALRMGLGHTRWPGRFEVLQKDPPVIIDGAHNIDGIRALVNNIKSHFKHKRVIAIIGLLQDKDYAGIIDEVLPVFDCFITVTPDNPRAVKADKLSSYLEQKGVASIPCDSYGDAVQVAISENSGEDVIIAFGSLYYIGAIRTIFASKQEKDA